MNIIKLYKLLDSSSDHAFNESDRVHLHMVECEDDTDSKRVFTLQAFDCDWYIDRGTKFKKARQRFVEPVEFLLTEFGAPSVLQADFRIVYDASLPKQKMIK